MKADSFQSVRKTNYLKWPDGDIGYFVKIKYTLYLQGNVKIVTGGK